MTNVEHAIDPVCGMTIRTDTAHTREHEGQTYFLCSAICTARFDRDAVAYVAVSRLNLEGWGKTPMPGFLMRDEDPPGAS